MPRRRITKVVSRTARPKLPEGDEGNDLSEMERKEKLRVFREDFDLEMKRKVQRLEEEKRQLLFDVDVNFHALTIQIPMAVRKMSLEEFMKSGGTIASALRWLSQNRKNTAEDMVSGRQRPRGKAARLGSIMEHGTTPAKTEEMKPPAMSTVKRGNRKQRTTVTSQQQVQRASSSRFRTPARGPGFTCETPLFTPKFDPRLPSTPEGERAPRRGERLVSIDGSPVCFDKRGKGKNSVIPVKFGNTMLEIPSIPDDMDLSAVTVPDLHSDTDKNIQRLHAILSSYLQKSSAS